MPKILEPEYQKGSTQRNIRFTDENWDKMLKMCSALQVNKNKLVNNLIAERYDLMMSEPTIKKAIDNIDSAISSINKAMNQLEKNRKDIKK